MASKHTPEQLAFIAGHRNGRWGYPASRSPYGAGDLDPRAVAWRKGWTAGNALHRQAIDAEIARGCDVSVSSQVMTTADEDGALRLPWQNPITGSGAGMNSAYFFACPACGVCVIDLEFSDLQRQRHEAWHEATVDAIDIDAIRAARAQEGR